MQEKHKTSKTQRNYLVHINNTAHSYQQTTVKRILIIGGGTAGHICPGLSVANQLSTQGHQIAWLGTYTGMEATMVPKAGYPLHQLKTLKLRGKSKQHQLKALAQLLPATGKCLRLLKHINPHVVLSMGGYVSAPGSFAAYLMRKPLIIHEQNTIPGMTNRWLATIATQTLSAFPGTFKTKHHAIVTGNPVYKVMTTFSNPENRPLTDRQNAPSKAIRLLVLGGSQGAKILNDTVPEAIQQLKQQYLLSVWHQTGRSDQARIKKQYQSLRINAQVDTFIDSMIEAYQWADLAICRSGAMTVSELAAVGLPSILIPLPTAADNHQTYNAYYLSQHKGAQLIPQNQLSISSLIDHLTPLCASKSTRLAMAKKAYQLGEKSRQAAQQIAAICLKAAKE